MPRSHAERSRSRDGVAICFWPSGSDPRRTGWRAGKLRPPAGGSRETYDQAQLAAHLPEPEEEPEEEPRQAGPRRRVVKYGKAFQNYRRTITHKLKQAVQEKLQDGTEADPTWTTEDMEEFLDAQVTFKAQLEHRTKERVARRNPQHMHHGKAMPMIVRPSDVILFRICLSSAHAQVVEASFGYDGPDVTEEDPQWVKWRTQTQVAKFFEFWDKALTKATRSLDERMSAGDEAVVQNMLEAPGAALWDYMLKKARVARLEEC